MGDDLTEQIIRRRAEMKGWHVEAVTSGVGVTVIKDGRPELISGLEHDLNQAWELTADFEPDELAAVWAVLVPGDAEASARAIAEAWWQRFGQGK